jgi:hypothetical protein
MAGTGSRKMGNAKAQNHSTNKRVSVGSKNTTSAKFVKPTPTPKQVRTNEAVARANRNADARDRLKAKVAAEQKSSKGVLGKDAIRRVRETKKFAKGGYV